MTTDTAPLTAEDFAHGIMNMRFPDVMKVVDAINAANGYSHSKRSRGKVDGMTLLKAAQEILEPDSRSKAAPRPAARKPSPAAISTAEE